MARPVHPVYDVDDKLERLKENGAEPLAWGVGGTDIPSSADVVLAADLAALQAEVDAAEADIATLESDLAALETRVDTAETDIDALQAADTALDGRLNAEEALSTSFDSRLDALEAETVVADLAAHIADLANPHEVKMEQVAIASFDSITGDDTLVLAQLGLMVNLENSDDDTPFTITIPENGDVAFPVGGCILFKQTDVGEFIFEGDVGVTLNSDNGKTMTNGQFTVCALIKDATNEWTLFGSLQAAP